MTEPILYGCAGGGGKGIVINSRAIQQETRVIVVDEIYDSVVLQALEEMERRGVLLKLVERETEARRLLYEMGMVAEKATAKLENLIPERWSRRRKQQRRTTDAQKRRKRQLQRASRRRNR